MHCECLERWIRRLSFPYRGFRTTSLTPGVDGARRGFLVWLFSVGGKRPRYDRRSFTSVGVRGRKLPGFNPRRLRWAISVRTSRNVGWPTAAVIFLIWRFRPSRIVISSQAVGTFFRKRIGTGRGGICGSSFNRITSAGFVLFPSIITPFLKRSSASSEGILSTCTRYVRGWLNVGAVRRC